MNPSPFPPAPNLLDEALGLGRGGRSPWRVALVQDCVETSGAFLLHHFLKRALSGDGAGAVVFVALAQPFSHYDRILRKMDMYRSIIINIWQECFLDPGIFQTIINQCKSKSFKGRLHGATITLCCFVGVGLQITSINIWTKAMSSSMASQILSSIEGCNLSLQRSKNKLHFIDLLNLELTGETSQNSVEDGLMNLYDRILRCIEANYLSGQKGSQISIIIDDISLLEIFARGSVNHVLDFILYCVNITSDTDCSLVILSHEDIYSSEDDPRLLSYLQYLSDVVIKTETLATGIAADVHGQLTIINKGASNEYENSMSKVHKFRFKVKENGVEIVYPGSQF